MIRRTVRQYSFCTLPKIKNDLLWYYKSGKSTVSIAQHISIPENGSKYCYPNFYATLNTLDKIINTEPQFLQQATKNIELEGIKLSTIFRLIINAGISGKQISLNINALKADPYIKRLIELRQGKMGGKFSQIIIDDPIKPGVDQEMLKAHILQSEKLLTTGLGLSIAFSLSKHNFKNAIYRSQIAKKLKSIHSNIVQSQSFATKKESFQQIIYSQGYKLQHLFLNPYSKGLAVESLADNDAFNLEEIVKILSIIDFEGKIVLENNQMFEQNCEYLDSALRKCGFSKKKLGDIDLIDEYMIL